jgi:hypothetical protein
VWEEVNRRAFTSGDSPKPINMGIYKCFFWDERKGIYYKVIKGGNTMKRILNNNNDKKDMVIKQEIKGRKFKEFLEEYKKGE